MSSIFWYVARCASRICFKESMSFMAYSPFAMLPIIASAMAAEGTWYVPFWISLLNRAAAPPRCSWRPR